MGYPYLQDQIFANNFLLNDPPVEFYLHRCLSKCRAPYHPNKVQMYGNHQQRLNPQVISQHGFYRTGL